ncbi:hypothetical protein F1640_14895 [Novosphingobium sp. NBM11]|uniref:Gp138 family membrane-puncturing spike protein n=1 Tax=Novosphingobium sp. NBM11 TaxID=2596914 RepID=UPI00189240FE|nr:Gp138 family membrane-puncturing spike protein [Novosphingobium sp. NBM11]MBF5091274.1 hypothetical protein [Novosphingobium sp. NBM11]
MIENITGFGDLGYTQNDASQTAFIVRQIMNGMATSAPVKVMAVHSGDSGYTVDVQVMVNQIDGKGNGIPHGTIHGLPVKTLRAGTCEIRIKPRVGDKGVVSFCHSDISVVKKTGAIGNPGSRRKFDWSDGIYLGSFHADGEATSVIEIGDDDNVLIKSPTVALQASDLVDIAGPVTTDTEYRVGGTKVVGTQQGAITAPTGGSTIDSQARTTINAILNALKGHGLIAS